MWENMSCFAFSKNAYCTSCHSVLTDLHMYLTYSTHLLYTAYPPFRLQPKPSKKKKKKKPSPPKNIK